MLLSVIFIVLIIAVFVGVAVYFGIYKPDDDLQTNMDNNANKLKDGVADIVGGVTKSFN